MTKLTPPALRTLLKKTGRHSDGQGLFFRVVGDGKAYFVYRFRIARREREMSLGPYPELGLGEARAKHAELRALVLRGVDPLAGRRGGKIILPTGMPTFGQCADAYLKTHESSWRSSKHQRQWSATLATHAAALKDMPVDQVDTEAVLECLRPIWNTTPETASRVRARIEIVLASAAVAGHIAPDKPNPARWGKWLELMLPSPRKVGKIDRRTGERVDRGNHPAMPYVEVPAFITRLTELDLMAAKALRFTILTAARSGEALNMTWDEVLPNAVWRIPASRMKMQKEHRVPLSEQALDILRELHEIRGSNPYVFAGRPQRPLSSMSMAMLLRRMDAGDITIHGFRSSFRDWMTEVEHVEYATSERCLAHTIGNSAALSYDRSDRLELRRPVMQKWANYIVPASNVVPLRRGTGQ